MSARFDNNSRPDRAPGIEHSTIDSRVLFVSGHGHDLGPLERELQAMGHTLEVRHVSSFEDFQDALSEYSPDVILVELNLTGFDGVKAMEYLEVNRLDVPMIIVSDRDEADEINVTANRGGRRLPDLIIQALRLDRRRPDKVPAHEGPADPFPEIDRVLLDVKTDSGTAVAIVEAGSNRLLYVNDVFGEIAGFSADELLSMNSILKLVLPDDVPLFEKAVQKAAVHKSRTSNFEIRIVRKDGLIAQLRFAVRQFEQNQNTRIAMIAHDITGATEDMTVTRPIVEADDLRSYWTAAENSTSFAVFDIDEGGKVRSWNHGAEQFTGYGASEIIGRGFLALMDDDEASDKAASFLEGGTTTAKFELETWFVHKGGQRFRAAISLAKLSDAAGASSGFSAFLRYVREEGVSHEQLREREAQLHSLAAYLQQTREEEKTFIARRLHDEFSQMLTAVRMDLSVLGKMTSRIVSEPLGRGSLLEKISSVSDILEKAIRSARDMITELRPAVLDELGLLTAVQWQVMEFENRTGIDCHITKLQHGEQFDPDVATTTFRTLQEALDNVERHSGATKAFISLQVIGGNIVLQVSDNGKGIDIRKLKAPSSIGIIGMRERVLALGGRLDVRTEPGKGTTLTVLIPRANNHVS